MWSPNRALALISAWRSSLISSAAIPGWSPNVVVLVATVRALKMHGGGPKVVAGKQLDSAYTDENLDLLRAGLGNLKHHMQNARRFGVPVVWRSTPSPPTLRPRWTWSRQAAWKPALRLGCLLRHWMEGGLGAVKLAEAVIKAAEKPSQLQFLYPLDISDQGEDRDDLQADLRRGRRRVLAGGRGEDRALHPPGLRQPAAVHGKNAS